MRALTLVEGDFPLTQLCVSYLRVAKVEVIGAVQPGACVSQRPAGSQDALFDNSKGCLESAWVDDASRTQPQ